MKFDKLEIAIQGFPTAIEYEQVSLEIYDESKIIRINREIQEEEYKVLFRIEDLTKTLILKESLVLEGYIDLDRYKIVEGSGIKKIHCQFFNKEKEE